MGVSSLESPYFSAICIYGCSMDFM